MDKQFYVLYLIPSRPDFAQTMNDEEKAIMYRHMNYWQEHMKKGMVIVFGPVFEPTGVYGLGIIAVNNEKELEEFMENDPAGQINRFEHYPIKAVVP